MDFVIAGPREHGVPGLVNLFGIESPGLTSSMALAELVRELALNAARSDRSA
jgi:L-2-hydroxyglutarate oxidase LhgO